MPLNFSPTRYTLKATLSKEEYAKLLEIARGFDPGAPSHHMGCKLMSKLLGGVRPYKRDK